MTSRSLSVRTSSGMWMDRRGGSGGVLSCSYSSGSM